MRSEGERSVKKGTEGDFSFFLSFVLLPPVGWGEGDFFFCFSFFLLFSSLSFSRFFIYFFTFLERLGRGNRNEIPAETRWSSKKGGGPKDSKQESPS